MDADQQHRLYDAIIALIVTFNSVLLVWLTQYQRRRHEREDVRHEAIAQHVQECVRAHKNT